MGLLSKAKSRLTIAEISNKKYFWRRGILHFFNKVLFYYVLLYYNFKISLTHSALSNSFTFCPKGIVLWDFLCINGDPYGYPLKAKWRLLIMLKNIYIMLLIIFSMIYIYIMLLIIVCQASEFWSTLARLTSFSKLWPALAVSNANNSERKIENKGWIFF